MVILQIRQHVHRWMLYQLQLGYEICNSHSLCPFVLSLNHIVGFVYLPLFFDPEFHDLDFVKGRKHRTKSECIVLTAVIAAWLLFWSSLVMVLLFCSHQLFAAVPDHQFFHQNINITNL